MFKFEIKLNQDWQLFRKNVLKFSDKRVEFFFKQFVEEIAVEYRNQLLRRIPKDQEFLSYRDSFRAFVSTASNTDFDEKIDSKDPVKRVEEYWSGVESLQVTKTFNELPIQFTRVKVKKFREEELSLESMYLFRFSPWTLDTLPYLPRSNDVYLSFDRVNKKEYLKIQGSKKKKAKYIADKLSEFGKSIDSKEFIISNLKAVDSYLDIALRLEFGLSGRKKAHWGPSAKYIEKIGAKDILKNKKILMDSILKPSFKGWRRYKPGIYNIPKGDISSFEDFIEKVTIA